MAGNRYPDLLVNARTAGGLDRVATGFVTLAFRKLGHTSQQLRVDRFLDEVHNTGGDPIRLIQLFGLSDPTALRYCADAATPTAPIELSRNSDERRSDPDSATQGVSSINSPLSDQIRPFSNPELVKVCQ